MALTSREYLADWACNKNIFLNIYIYYISKHSIKKRKGNIFKKRKNKF